MERKKETYMQSNIKDLYVTLFSKSFRIVNAWYQWQSETFTKLLYLRLFFLFVVRQHIRIFPLFSRRKAQFLSRKGPHQLSFQVTQEKKKRCYKICHFPNPMGISILPYQGPFCWYPKVDCWRLHESMCLLFTVIFTRKSAFKVLLSTVIKLSRTSQPKAAAYKRLQPTLSCRGMNALLSALP